MWMVCSYFMWIVLPLFDLLTHDQLGGPHRGPWPTPTHWFEHNHDCNLRDLVSAHCTAIAVMQRSRLNFISISTACGSPTHTYTKSRGWEWSWLAEMHYTDLKMSASLLWKSTSLSSMYVPFISTSTAESTAQASHIFSAAAATAAAALTWLILSAHIKPTLRLTLLWG